MRCTNPQEIWHDKKHLVPCGKCIPCLGNKRSDWIFRLEQEHKASKGALFITLTYSEKFCPSQLVKKHLQDFMKRLRKREAEKVRYYAVGEYGTKRKRPHYHILLFNCDLSGKSVKKAWCNKAGEPFGIVHIGQVTASSIAYCTKYVIQPEQKEANKQKPFTLMSRRFGIGAHYLTDNMVAWHRSNKNNFAMVNGVKKKLPRFYKDKIWYRLKKKDGSIIEHKDREAIAHASKWHSIKEYRKELRYFVKKYGVENALAKMREFRDAHLAQVKVKVSYTENL